MRIVEFVEPAIIAIDHQHVPVAIARRRIALNRSVPRHRHRPRVALREIGGVIDRHQRRSALDDIWNADHEPAYNPDPKSRCSVVDSPMKLMIALEFGSTG